MVVVFKIFFGQKRQKYTISRMSMTYIILRRMQHKGLLLETLTVFAVRP